MSFHVMQEVNVLRDLEIIDTRYNEALNSALRISEIPYKSIKVSLHVL